MDLYDSYDPPYLIWNRYHMVPPHVWSPTYAYGPSHMYDMMLMTLMVSPCLIWNRYLMIPLPYMEQVLYGSPTCTI